MNRIRFCFQFAATILFALSFMMLPHAGSQAATLTLGVPGPGSGPGNDPLLDPNSWFVFPGQTATTNVTLSSTDSSVRTVRVTAQCCLDTHASKNVALAGLDLSLTAPPGSVVKDDHPQVTPTGQETCMVLHGSLVCPTHSSASALIAVPAGGSVTLALGVAAQGAVTPGRYLIVVSAVSADDSPTSAANTATPILNVMAALPVDNAEVPLPCPSPPPTPGGATITGTAAGSSTGNGSQVPPLEVLILRPLLRDFLFPAKAQNPTLGVFTVGVSTLTGLAAWQMTIAPPPTPLPPTSTAITLINNAGWDKMLVPYNSSTCPHEFPPLPVAVNSSLTTTIDLTKASTILLRHQACANWVGLVCTDKSRFDDIVLFSDTNFATLFGGRAVTLDWFYSKGE
jgi:hypothetical protein